MVMVYFDWKSTFGKDGLDINRSEVVKIGRETSK